MGKTTSKKKSKPAKHYHWLVTPDAYLAAALALCEAILPRSFPDQVSFDNDFFKKRTRSAHANFELIFSIIFNLKHAIELYLKGLGCVDNGYYRTTHDLREIFDFIIANATNDKCKQILQTLNDETWPIIKKYYYGTYNPSIKFETDPDKYNDAERYPESAAYQIKSPSEWVTGIVIKSIEKDIRFLEKKFAQAKRDIFAAKK